jgi:putative aldouronate transport system permease protein
MIRTRNSEGSTIRTLSKKFDLLLMGLPCILLVIVFNYAPLFGWIYGFFDYKPGMRLSQSEFVGFKFLIEAFTDTTLLTVLRNTLVLGMLSLAASVIPPIFAMFLNELYGRRAKKVIQTVTTFPQFISWILVFSIFFIFFSVDDGYVNKVLLALGLIKEPTNLLANEGAVWWLQTLLSMWKNIGFSAIIYLASIAGIDPGLYQAADVDGAGRFRKMFHITVPELLPTFFTLLLLGIGNILSNGFDQYYLFYNNLVSDKVLVLDVYLYQVGLGMNLYSLSTALGMTKTIISVILLFGANSLSRAIRGTAII